VVIWWSSGGLENNHKKETEIYPGSSNWSTSFQCHFRTWSPIDLTRNQDDQLVYSQGW